METRLRYQAATETRNRKRLRPSDVAEWELRIGRFRVFYNVDEKESVVIIAAVGFKIGNVLFIRDEKRAL
uniref:ParE toxin of type II toxin-antitoxin system, parDE n=1 Tax=Candidatus Kentrum sp. DK TaxID=2126562 RepID=A0A450RXJ5_9GAMM|nr:MAG: ParE toxin of type II toxin-antitoxin system, parDE [Candidatus Kentron sp. DK]